MADLDIKGLLIQAWLALNGETETPQPTTPYPVVDSRAYATEESSKNFLDARDAMVRQGIPESSAEIFLVNRTPAQEIYNLPVQVKADLITSIAGARDAGRDFKDTNLVMEGVSMSAEDALLKLYDNNRPSQALQAWDLENRLELAKVLRTDPALVDARRRWDIAEGQAGHMGIEERHGVFQHIVDITAQVYARDGKYGITSTPVDLKEKMEMVVVKSPWGVESDPDATIGRAAEYNFSTERISTSAEYLSKESFDFVAQIAVHEEGHRIQHNLVQGVQNGLMVKTDPLYFDAVIFAANAFGEDSYFRTPQFNMVQYKNNPIETHSHELDYIGSYAGTYDRETGEIVGDEKLYGRQSQNLEQMERFVQWRRDMQELLKLLPEAESGKAPEKTPEVPPTAMIRL